MSACRFVEFGASAGNQQGSSGTRGSVFFVGLEIVEKKRKLHWIGVTALQLSGGFHS